MAQAARSSRRGRSDRATDESPKRRGSERSSEEGGSAVDKLTETVGETGEQATDTVGEVGNSAGRTVTSELKSVVRDAALEILSPAAKSLDAGALRARLQGALAKLATQGGSSMHPGRHLVLSEPPSIDANEITYKGYINQRAVLERRWALVERLYAGGADVFTAG